MYRAAKGCLLFGFFLCGSEPSLAQPVKVTPGTPAPTSSGLTFPFKSTITASAPLFWLVQLGKEQPAIWGTGNPGTMGWSDVAGGTGVRGSATGGGGSAGVEGRAPQGTGVYGGGVTGVEGAYRPDNELQRGYAVVANPASPDERGNRGALGRETSGVEGSAVLKGSAAFRGRFQDFTEVVLAQQDTVFTGKYKDATRIVLGDKTNAVTGKSTAPGGKGVAGSAEGKDGVGVYGQNTEGLAGFFRGKVTVEGILMAQQIFAPKGLVGSGAKFFKIDHPLEPAEKYLWHASIESDARKNMYDGVAVLDAQGTGWVLLPAWFQALNKDFRYQLTCIGGYAQVFIAQEIKDNRFQIAGGKPGLKVSWQVTGVRQDAYANANPMRVEEPKSAADRGRYLNPVELGFPASLRIGAIAVASIKP